MSANRKPEGPFEFGIMELSRFLDKSPATIRRWEDDGLFVFPRDKNNDRRFTSKDVRGVVEHAATIGRINQERQHLVEAMMTLVEIFEQKNGKK